MTARVPLRSTSTSLDDAAASEQLRQSGRARRRGHSPLDGAVVRGAAVLAPGRSSCKRAALLLSWQSGRLLRPARGFSDGRHFRHSGLAGRLAVPLATERHSGSDRLLADFSPCCKRGRCRFAGNAVVMGLSLSDRTTTERLAVDLAPASGASAFVPFGEQARAQRGLLPRLNR
jgi:hypothetical protein